MPGKLLQMLGVAFGLAVLLGNTIVVGILRTPGDVAKSLPDTALFLGVWVAGGLYALLGAITMAEPGAMVASSGGQYVFVRRGLGPYPGFVVGWSDWISTAASGSFMCMVFAEYLVPFVPALEPYRVAIGCGVMLLVGLLNWRSMKTSDTAQQVLSALKALLFTGLIAAGLLLAVPELPPAPVVAKLQGAALFSAVIVALQAVIYTYDGWTGPLYFGGEIKNPGRDIPRSMATGVLLVLAIYLLINVTFVRVLGVARMAGDPFVASTVGRAIFGAQSDTLVRSLILVSVLGGLNAIMLMASRPAFAMAEDGLLPRALRSVNAGGTPVGAHWASIGIGLAFILTDSYNTVLAIVAFFFVANYALSFLSVFALRRKEPDTPRPFRVPGYPFTPALVLVASIAFLVGAVIGDKANSVRALVLLGLSYPIYLGVRRLRLGVG